MPAVNPQILSWARDSAGLSRAEAVSMLPLGDAYGKTALERLEELESGAVSPTRPMLVKMAKRYRRPLVTFYLAEPPRPGDRGTDFRRLGGDPPPASDADVQTLVRQVMASQSIVREVLVEEEAEEVAFVGSLAQTDGRQAILAEIGRLLGDSHPRNAPNPTEAFKRLRAALHDQGVFILLKVHLGSHHTTFDTERFRGFALADRLAPFIVINGNDAKAAWSFTLVHELVHLLLGNTGISGGSGVGDHGVERFCNGVAAEYLLPRHVIESSDLHGRSFDELLPAIDALANEHNASRPVVAYGLRRAKLIDDALLWRLLGVFRAQWQQAKRERKEKQREKELRLSPYVVTRHRAGDALLDVVRRAHRDDSLSTTRAAVALGVQPTQVRQMLNAVPGSAGRVIRCSPVVT